MNARLLATLLLATLSPAPLVAQDATATVSAAIQEKLDSELLAACRDSWRSDEVAELLEQGANPNFLCTLPGAVMPTSPVHIAAYMGNIRALRALLRHGGDPKLNGQPGTAQHSPINGAVIAKKYISARLLLEAAPQGWTADELAFPLQAAIMTHSEPLADLLLKHGADPHALSFDGSSVLVCTYWAPYGKASLDYLLRQGFRTDTPGDAHVAAASYLLLADRENCLDMLLDAGYDPNRCDAEGDCMLTVAVHMGRRDRVAQLLERGADPRIVDAYGRTLASIAPAGSDIPALLKTYADKLDAEGRPQLPPPPALELAPLSQAVVAGDEATLRRLLDEGADANEIHPGTGNSALTFAIHLNRPGMARLLVEHGADALLRNKSRSCPLDEAVSIEGALGISTFSDILWPADLSTLSREQKHELAGSCAMTGNTRRLQQLLDAGLLEEQPERADFLLVSATIANQPGTAKILLQAGADPFRDAFFSYSAYDYTYCRPEFRELFESVREQSQAEE